MIEPPENLYTDSPLRLDADAAETWHRKVMAQWRQALRDDFPAVFENRAELRRFIRKVEKEVARGDDVGAILKELLR